MNQLLSLNKENETLKVDKDSKDELALEIKNIRAEIKNLSDRRTNVVEKLIPLSLLDDIKKGLDNDRAD